MRKALSAAFAIMLGSIHAGAQTAPASPFPPDSEIRKILVDRIDNLHQSVGIVVGVIDSQGRRVVEYGSLNQGDPRPLNGDTVFEIGSVTKVFTSLLLSDMVQGGEVKLDDPISKYLPAGVKAPEHNGKQITLVDLSTHTSGLPRLPTNFHPGDSSNPYADYSTAQLYEMISTYQLTRDPGTQFEYSNLGGGLLGNLLARRAGVDYEGLVKERITVPLFMESTGITLFPSMKARMAVGHDAELKAVPNWDLPALAGAGALRSTANDLLIFLGANLGYTQTPLAGAMAAMRATRRPAGGAAGGEIGLGWLFLKTPHSEIAWHNGGTGGFRSYVGYDLKSRAGVVVLSNTSTTAGVDDIGRHLLDASLPLMSPPKQHKEISVDPKIFDNFVGRYQLAPNFIITVTREGNQFFAQATAQPRFQIFAEGPHEFFLKVVDAQITFETDTSGRASSLTLHQNGRDTPGKRIP